MLQRWWDKEMTEMTSSMLRHSTDHSILTRARAVAPPGGLHSSPNTVPDLPMLNCMSVTLPIGRAVTARLPMWPDTPMTRDDWTRRSAQPKPASSMELLPRLPEWSRWHGQQANLHPTTPSVVTRQPRELAGGRRRSITLPAARCGRQWYFRERMIPLVTKDDCGDAQVTVLSRARYGHSLPHGLDKIHSWSRMKCVNKPLHNPTCRSAAGVFKWQLNDVQLALICHFTEVCSAVCSAAANISCPHTVNNNSVVTAGSDNTTQHQQHKPSSSKLTATTMRFHKHCRQHKTPPQSRGVKTN